jgi:molybdenum cofactor cytidylyltransferase
MISAIVLAAGLSQRMGVPKMTLPWGSTTVIGQVVSVLTQAGVEDILVVTGGARQQVEEALKKLPARPVFNPRYGEDHMLLSLQVGLVNLPEGSAATLVALGDQPQMQVAVVKAVLEAYQVTGAALVVPSFKMRRGHPWLVDHSLWSEILTLQPPQTMRQVLNIHAGQIYYLPVDNASILRDLDTPEDYESERPPVG